MFDKSLSALMNSTKTILLISSGQPSANPRLVKEALCFAEAGFKVKVVYCPISPWADANDKVLFDQNTQIEWIKAGYHVRDQKWRYLLARIRQKCYHYLFQLFNNSGIIALRSMTLFSQNLMIAGIKHKADIYIGHNLGALPGVIDAAKKHGGIAIFDFEDFHRGEDAADSLHWQKVVAIENSFVPSIKFATAASPLIAEEYKKLFTSLSLIAVNNCFPAAYISALENVHNNETIKLFWVSQYVGKNRGLELIIQALGELKQHSLQLILLGNCSVDVKEYLIKLAGKYQLHSEQLVFIDPVLEGEIVRIASACDIGLATEDSVMFNRDICLSNKIFLYLLAGNAILFSNTRAQKQFLSANPGIGVLYEQDSLADLKQCLLTYINDRNLLLQHRKAALSLAEKTYNWEVEKLKELALVRSLLTNNIPTD
jgi:glycosyltransferase involved in cell wall biosynthesis